MTERRRKKSARVQAYGSHWIRTVECESEHCKYQVRSGCYDHLAVADNGRTDNYSHCDASVISTPLVWHQCNGQSLLAHSDSWFNVKCVYIIESESCNHEVQFYLHSWEWCACVRHRNRMKERATHRESGHRETTHMTSLHDNCGSKRPKMQ